ncbi:unnamed protein product, partial [Chrysoparadoxa australica]
QASSLGPEDALEMAGDDSPFAAQARIRQNAIEMQDYLKDLGSWEKDIRKKDRKLSKGVNRAPASTTGRSSNTGDVPAVRAGGGKVSVGKVCKSSSQRETQGREKANQSSNHASSSKPGSAAAHTYDKGYKKWERFDVDAALESDESDGEGEEEEEDAEEQPQDEGSTATDPSAPATPTPATIVGQVRPARAVVPEPLGQVRDADLEEEERRKGNEHFKSGDFAAAAKCYTRCLGMNSKNVLAFSNRAMAYIKLREFLKAEQDCTLALRIDPQHAKSFQRRACARNALGMHRAALADLIQAGELMPNARDIRQETNRSRELLKAAMHRCPKKRVSITPELQPQPLQPLQQQQQQQSAKGPQLAAEVTPTSTSGLDSCKALDLDSCIGAGDREAEESDVIEVRAGEAVDVATTGRDSRGVRLGRPGKGSGAHSNSSAPIGQQSDDDDDDGTKLERVERVEANRGEGCAGVTSHVPQKTCDATVGIEDDQNDAKAEVAVDEAKVTAEQVKAEVTVGEEGTASQAAAGSSCPALPTVATKLPAAAPKTLFEMERDWRSIHKDSAMFAAWLRMFKASTFKRVFKESTNPDIVSSLLHLLREQVVVNDPKEAFRILKHLSKCSGLAMTIMMLADRDKEAVQEVVEVLQGQGCCTEELKALL